MANPQGTKRDAKRPQSRPTPAPVTAAQVKRQTQAAVNKADQPFAKPPKVQRVGGRQNPYRG